MQVCFYKNQIGMLIEQLIIFKIQIELPWNEIRISKMQLEIHLKKQQTKKYRNATISIL